MTKEEVILKLKDIGLLAVVRVETIERGYEIAQGCLDGGVGAGTVLDGTTARLAIMNGAQFIIAPCYDEGVQEMCNLYQIPYAPGCTSYTEMLTALKAGASFIKAFPISNYYGPDLAKVIKVPCPQVPIMASGGANFDNLATWFKNGVDCVGLGGLLTKGTTEEIATNAKRLREIVLEVREG